MSRARLTTLTLSLLAGLGCSNAGDNLGFGPPSRGAMSAQVYYDLDFDGGPSGPDTTIAGLAVYLLVAGTQDTVATDSTDANGVVDFANLLPGQYSIAVDSLQVLGDTMVTVLTPNRVTLTNRGAAQFISARVGYPILTIAEARTAAAGRKVVVSGTALAGPQAFSDTTAYLRASGSAIRLTRAAVTFGGSVLPGDLVRVLGLTASRTGQPVLDSARMVLLFPGALPAEDTLTSAEAANALVGARDADLVRVVAGEVVDTLGQGADFRVTLDDGSGPLEVLLDAALQLGPGPVVPGDSLNVAGVLVPLGGGNWQLKPRAQLDITVF